MFDTALRALFEFLRVDPLHRATTSTVKVTSDDLETALQAARAAAIADGRPGAVVLLSPAAASFDQFASFEARGERFRDLVEALPGNRTDLDSGGRVLQ